MYRTSESLSAFLRLNSFEFMHFSCVGVGSLSNFLYVEVLTIFVVLSTHSLIFITTVSQPFSAGRTTVDSFLLMLLIAFLFSWLIFVGGNLVLNKTPTILVLTLSAVCPLTHAFLKESSTAATMYGIGIHSKIEIFA